MLFGEGDKIRIRQWEDMSKEFGIKIKQLKDAYGNSYLHTYIPTAIMGFGENHKEKCGKVGLVHTVIATIGGSQLLKIAKETALISQSGFREIGILAGVPFPAFLLTRRCVAAQSLLQNVHFIVYISYHIYSFL